LSYQGNRFDFSLAGTLPPSHCVRSRFFARVAELADAYGSGPYGATRGGSSPLASSSSCRTTDPRSTSNCPMLVATAVAYFEPAAQRAFISSESRLRPAGVSAPFFRFEAFCFPPAFLLAAQRAFISWESFLRPAGVSWPFVLAGG